MIMFSEYVLYYGLYMLECLSVGTKALSLWVRQIFASSSLTILAYEWVKERQSGQSEAVSTNVGNDREWGKGNIENENSM